MKIFLVNINISGLDLQKHQTSVVIDVFDCKIDLNLFWPKRYVSDPQGHK